MTETAGELLAMPEDWTRALAVVAHPDDMEFGGAAAVASWTAAGRTVSYLLASRGEAGIDGLAPERSAAVREAEQRESAAVVGVTEVEFLGHPDGSIEYGVPLRRDLAAALRRYRPELVVGLNYRDLNASGRWNQPDHRAVGRAVLDAVGDAGNRWIFRDLPGEPWPGVRYVAFANSPTATHAVDISDALDKGVNSLQAHATYLDSIRDQLPPDLRAAFAAYAGLVGQRFGNRPAVAFELIPR